MTTTELLALFREEVVDKELPYLWSDALIYGYIDAAQKQFCIDTYGIEDSRSFSVAVTPDEEWYPLDQKILKIRGAIELGTGRDVSVLAFEKAALAGITFAGQQGIPQALITGMEKNNLRLWPRPVVATSIELRVFRLPVTVEVGDDFEIDERHHRYLLNWAKHLAYDVQDSETYDKNASEKYKARHKEYCAAARDEQSRLNRPTSVVTYGGI